MSNGRSSTAVRDLQALFDVGVMGTLTDGQLLARFVARREGAVFEALIHRHGPMVWGVCRSILRDHHDAEDAFQATFLVLARKASTILPREKVGNWLFGVAYQTARKASSTRARRAKREGRVTDMPEPEAVSEDRKDDLTEWLDGEVSRLPEKYRIPIVLCELGGKTHREAADQLGWPIGTVSGRLSRARAMLARQLSRRGESLSAGSLIVLLTQESASASMPTKLIASTARAARLFAAGGVMSAGVVSAQVAALSGEVMKTMLVSRIKIISAMLLVAFALAAAGTGIAYQAPTTEAPQSPGQPHRAAKDLTGVKTLKEAVDVVKQDLIRKGKTEYAALISEQRVREAMQTGIRAYEAHLEKGEQRNPGEKEYFLVSVRPIFMKIIEEGTWPPHCSFFHFFTLGSTVGNKPLGYDGFWLRLQVETPKEKFGAFALPIIDMAYGKMES